MGGSINIKLNFNETFISSQTYIFAGSFDFSARVHLLNKNEYHVKALLSLSVVDGSFLKYGQVGKDLKLFKLFIHFYSVSISKFRTI